MLERLHGSFTVVVARASPWAHRPPRAQARAFEPLFTTKGGGGTGLGLATVAAFADEVDGSVHLASEPRCGTRVSLVLPGSDRRAGEAPIGGHVPVGGARVLLVGPGERTRRVIARMLQGAGYRVTSVASAEEALRALDGVATDLLITELSLPGMTGKRLLVEVRRRVPGPGAVMLAAVDAPDTLDGTPGARQAVQPHAPAAHGRGVL